MSTKQAFPMLNLQKGIAYECQLNPDIPMYISQIVIKVEYQNIDIYKKAWQHVLNKYEIFRTRFVFGKLKEDVQVIVDECELVWDEINIEFREIQNIAEVKKRILLNDFPLTNFTLAKTENGNFLIWSFHHILLDGWSSSIVLEEVDNLYSDFIDNGQQIKFNEKDNSYSKFVLWKLSSIKNNDLVFWTKYFEKASDFIFPKLTNSMGLSTFGEKYIDINVKVSDIEEYCRKKSVSPATFFQTTFAIFLGLYLKKEQVAFNVIDSGRTRGNFPNLDKVVGLLINNSFRYYDINTNTTFSTFLQNVHNEELIIRENEFISSQSLNPSSRSSINLPTTNITFVYENYPSAVESKKYKIISGNEMSSDDITLSVGANGDFFAMKLMHSLSVINSFQASEILDTICRFINSVIYNEQNSPLLINHLKKEIKYSEITAPRAKIPTLKTFYDQFKNIAKKSADKVAINEQQGSLTFNDLCNQIELIALNLSKLDLRDTNSIGIIGNRSSKSISLMSALQYLHIPYTFLDDKNSKERLEYILYDSEIKYIINCYDNLNDLPDINNDYVIINYSSLVNQTLDKIEDLNVRRLPKFSQLIYTSGSTGKPKGIELTFENILSLSFNNGFYEVKEDDNFAQASSMAFDASIFEIWVPLLNGASVTIIPEPVIDISNWEKQIKDKGITTAWLTSGLFNTFSDLNISVFESLNSFFVGGEIISPKHVLNAMNQCEKTTFYNGYGPTENTTFTTVYKIPRNIDANTAIPIGRLLNNSTARVVDELGNVLPIGVPGELVVSGTGIANGYHNSNSKNSFSYVENFGNCYSTGDIVVFDGDNFHFVERKDSQVKIRGFRVELSEIEQTIEQIPNVERAVVICTSSLNGIKELVAFYIGTIEKEELRKVLRKKLPSYMLPNILQVVTEIPLTLNGKVDKKKLLESQILDNTFKVPNREKVPSCFSKTLSKYLNISERDLDINLDLFEIGVDSLMAVRLNAELNNEFSQNVSLRDFVEAGSISNIIKLYNFNENIDFKDNSISSKNSNLLSVDDMANHSLCKASKMQKTMYYYQVENKEKTIYNIPYVRKERKDEKSIAQIIERFYSFIESNSVFHAYLKEDLDGELNWYSLNKRKSYKINSIKASSKDSKNLSTLIKKELNYNFDLSNKEEPLLRFTIIEDINFYYIVIVMHHIISDGTSMGIMLNKIFNSIDYSNDNQNYFDFLKSYEEDLPDDIRYWDEKLNSIAPIPLLDRVEDNFQHQGRTENFPLDSDFLNKVDIVSNKCKTSKYSILLTLYSQFLMLYFNRESIFVGTPISIRKDSWNNTFGMFLSFLPIISHRNQAKSFSEILFEDKIKIFEAIRHSSVDISTLSSLKSTKGSLSSIVQVVFNYQENEIDDTMVDDDIVTKFKEFIQFPLTFTIYNTPLKPFVQIEYANRIFTLKQIQDLLSAFLDWSDRILDSIEKPLGLTTLFSEEKSATLITKLNPKFTFNNEKLERYLTKLNIDNNDIGIVDYQIKFTYSEIYSLVNKIDEKLKKSGAYKGMKICFFGIRSWQQVVIFYLCLLKEYVYVPIDSKHSSSRLKDVVSELRPDLIISSYKVKNESFNIINVDDLFGESVSLDVEIKGINESEYKNLAYILFTSGTTGKPKGVQISRDNLAYFASTYQKDWNFEIGWRSAFLTSISFDASIMEMMTALSLGNSLYIFNDEHQNLPIFIKDNRLNSIIITPSLYSALDFSECTDLKLVISGGDKFRKNNTISLTTKVINGYGPTEGTVGISNTDANSDSTIGIPTSNSIVLVMDKNFNILPNGVIGEICIVGPSVMSSYLNRVDNENVLCSAPDFLKKYGPKIYRTGDLGYFDNTERLNFYGRNDSQVKVRGHRIELSEITERALTDPQIKDAFTNLVKVGTGSTSIIVLYIVLQPKVLFEEERLKKHLSNTLPSYMIPDKVIVVESFELTINGKIDLSKLPEVLPVQDDTSEDSSVELNDFESKLLYIWKETFNLEQININTNFYDIGGDSIKAIQIVSKFRKVGFDLSINDIYRYQTISSISENFIKNESDVTVLTDLQLLTEFPLLPIQEWFFRLELKKPNHWNQSNFLVIENNDELQLFKTISRVYGRHPILRAKISTDDKEKKVIIIDEKLFELDNIIHKFSSQEEFEKQYSNLQDSIDIFNGPTSKIAYYINEGKIYLYWIIHHLFIDSYSWHVLSNELNTINNIDNNYNLIPDLMTERNIVNNTLETTFYLPSRSNYLLDTSVGIKEYTIKKELFKDLGKCDLGLLTGSLLTTTIAKHEGINFTAIRENNSRFKSESSKYDFSQTVGWMTDFTFHSISKLSKWEDNYGILINNNQDNLNLDNCFFLNITNITEEGASINPKVIIKESDDIDLSNLQCMPPTINIINTSSELIITFLNLKNSEIIWDKLSDELQDINKVAGIEKYIKEIDKIEECVISSDEFSEIYSFFGEKIESVYPLFPLQHEMSLSTVNSASNYINHISWTTESSVEKFVSRFNQLYSKYEALRTSIFHTSKLNYVQVIQNDEEPMIYNYVSLKKLSESDQETYVNQTLIKESAKFIPQNGSQLYALYIFQIDDERIKVLWLFNHLILDGWSIGIILKELWSNDRIRTNSYETNLSYVKWLLNNDQKLHKHKLNNADVNVASNSIGRLFTNTDLAVSKTKNNVDRHFRLNEELSERVSDFSKTYKISIANIFGILWGYILCCLTNSERVVFGSVNSGRNCPVENMENKVGLFINTNPVFFDIIQSEQVIEFINRISETLNQLNQNQSISQYEFRKIYGLEQKERLFETIFVFENYPEPDSNNTFNIKDFKAKEQSGLPLSLSAGGNKEIVYKLSYDSDIISENDISVLGEWLYCLLEYVVTTLNLNMNVSNLPDLSNKISLKNKKQYQSEHQNETLFSKKIEEQSSVDKTKELLEVYSNILGQNEISVDDNFFENGGDSLKLSKLIYFLKEKFNIEFDALKFFENPTLRFIIDSSTIVNQGINVDMVLPVIHKGTSFYNFEKNKSILITGATGLVGSELVYQNLKKGHEVYCISRESTKSARERVVECLNEISLSDDILSLDKLHVYSGDITEDNFGLTYEDYFFLASKISIIYHAAGNINFMSSFEDSYVTNVGGIDQIMKFAQTSVIKKVNYISTLSVIGHDHYLVEDIDLAPISYVKTKAISEKYLRQYRSVRDNVIISRLGRISGNTRTHIVPKNDLFWRLIHSIIQLGAYPEEFLGNETDLTPVDIIVEKLIDDTDNDNAENQINNYFSNYMISFGKVITFLESYTGEKLLKISYNEWLDRVENSDDSNSIKVLAPLFRENVFYEPEETTIISEHSPDKGYQKDIILFGNGLKDEVFRCYVKDLLR